MAMGAYRRLARQQVPTLDGWRHWEDGGVGPVPQLPWAGPFHCGRSGARARMNEKWGRAQHGMALKPPHEDRGRARRVVTGATAPSR
jgi:hypothetical protein